MLSQSSTKIKYTEASNINDGILLQLLTRRENYQQLHSQRTSIVRRAQTSDSRTQIHFRYSPGMRSNQRREAYKFHVVCTLKMRITAVEQLSANDAPDGKAHTVSRANVEGAPTRPHCDSSPARVLTWGRVLFAFMARCASRLP